MNIMNFKEWLKIQEYLLSGNSDPKKQVHIFDFDDTLGVTYNANGIMLYKDGKPAHTSEKDVSNWLQSIGINNNYMLKGPNGSPIENVPSRNGFVAYVSSSGLAAIQKQYPSTSQFVTGVSEPNGQGDELLIDFTPSSNVDSKSTVPIEKTINKLKQANSKGSKTMVLTARKAGAGQEGTSIDGKKVTPTNKQDILDFLQSKGTVPNQGVEGVSGQNKGNAIVNKFVNSNEPPEEIHFYDDLKKNTDEVEAAIANKYEPELYVYGPGHFDKGEIDAFKATKSYDGKPKALKPNAPNPNAPNPNVGTTIKK